MPNIWAIDEHDDDDDDKKSESSHDDKKHDDDDDDDEEESEIVTSDLEDDLEKPSFLRRLAKRRKDAGDHKDSKHDE